MNDKSTLKILLLEPFFTGSHKQWALGYQNASRHDVVILSLPGQWWKWRMHGGAVTLAENFNNSTLKPDVIVATDMLDLSLFLSLTRQRTGNIPVALYFHENQITYPWSETDSDVSEKRDRHYGFINYTSALAADRCFFNSQFHMDSFLSALSPFLKGFPDQNNLETVDEIAGKSSVLYLGMNFQGFDGIKGTEPGDFPVVLWNHRWEYDKNPEDFFQALFILAEKGKDFRLIVLGEGFSTVPPIFNHAREKLGDRIIHFGYAEDFSHYGELLHRADIIPITSKQEFFGGSLMEALYCSTIPLLPRRLTYGELVPPEEYHSYFYDTFDELVHTLEYLIINYRTIDRSPFRKGAARFSWEVLAEAYDSELAGVACLRK